MAGHSTKREEGVQTTVEKSSKKDEHRKERDAAGKRRTGKSTSSTPKASARQRTETE